MANYRDTTPDTPRNRGLLDAPHLTPATPMEDIRSIMLNRVSWGAVFSGVALSIALQIVLNLFGFGLGAAAVDTAAAPGYMTAPEAVRFSTGALLWWAVSGIIAACAGGYAAGRLSGEPRESTAAWHGLTCWAASLLVVASLAISGAGVLVGGSMSAAGIAGGPVAERAYGPAAPGAGTAQGGGTAAATAMTGEEIELMQDAAARAALICAIALVLGGFAAWVGGWNGAVEPTITDRQLREESLH